MVFFLWEEFENEKYRYECLLFLIVLLIVFLKQTFMYNDI